MSAAKLTVYGQIASKGSRTLGKRSDGSLYTRPASTHEHAWVETVARQALWLRQQLESPVAPYRVELIFYFAPPARASRGYPSRLDVDKCARAVLDGLVRGGMLEDDRHVTELVAHKHWAATANGECCHIVVRTAGQARSAA